MIKITEEKQRKCRMDKLNKIKEEINDELYPRTIDIRIVGASDEIIIGNRPLRELKMIENILEKHKFESKGLASGGVGDIFIFGRVDSCKLE